MTPSALIAQRRDILATLKAAFRLAVKPIATAILFDPDGTLADSAAAITAALSGLRDSAVDADAAATLSIPFYLRLQDYRAAGQADRQVFASFAHHRELPDLLVSPLQAPVC